MSCNELFYWVIKLAKRKASFHFPEARKLKRILWILWIFKTNFVNCKNSSYTAHSVICFNNFEEKIAERGKKCKLLRQLHPAPAIYNDSKSNLSLFGFPLFPENLPENKKWSRWISFISSCWWISWYWLNIRTKFTKKIHL